MSVVDPVRAYLRGWGDDLDDHSLIQAVVAAGILEANRWLRVPDMIQQIRSMLDEGLSSTDWRPPDVALELIEPMAAVETVADLPLIRLHVRPGPGMQTDLYWWLLFLRTIPAVQVVVGCDAPSRDLEWHWPLRVGFLDDPESVSLRDSFANNLWWPDLQTIVATGEPCDLLVLPMTLSQVPDAAPDCAIPVVTGEIDVAPEEVPGAADRVAMRFDSWGCHLANQPGAPVDWLNRLVESLAHNDPIETALGYADYNGGATATYTTLMAFASTWSRLENVMWRFTDQLNRLGDHMVEVPADLQGSMPGAMPTGRVPAGALGRFLDDALRSGAFTYSGETHEATGFARLVAAIGELPAGDHPMGNGMGAGGEGEDGVEVRIVNGRVLHDGDPHRLGLVKGDPYQLEVWIGVESEESITQPGAPAFPDEELPTGPNRIDVVFTCLDNEEDVQRTHVTLPEKGDSDRALLDLRFAETGTVFGRLALLHQGRVIQTAVLRADVVAGEPSRLGRPEIEVEAVMRSRIGAMPTEERFDLAVVVNRDTAGRKTTSAISDDGVSIRSAAGLERGIEDLTAVLEAVADDPDAFAEMTSETTLDWLFQVSNLGATLYGAFVEDHDFDPDHFSSGRVQVISARADAYLPVEFFYELRPPTVAVLCDGWEKAVLEGECGSCEEITDGDRPICLSAFWGVKYVIERHAHNAEYGEISGDWILQREPITGRDQLKPLESIVWAYSDNILSGDRKKLGSALSKKKFPATRASNWEDVQTQVGTIDPSMIFLLPHTDKDRSLDASELGGTLEVFGRIRDRMCSPRDRDYLVVILGCDTAHTGVPFQGMVPEFRKAGAGVVVSTVNAILGRHAVPVARELLTILKGGSDEGMSMGDALRDLRRRGLADGYPMVLSVVAFGDADWVLTA
jgi:hypothetical protein